MSTLRTAIRSFWQARSAREQFLLCVAAIAVFLALWWTLLLMPAWQSLQRSHERLPELRAQSLALDEVLMQVAGMQRPPRRSAAPQAMGSALQDSLVAEGLQAATISVLAPADQGEQARWALEFPQAPASSVFDWLGREPAVLGLRVHRLDLERAVREGKSLPGRLSGRIVLVLPVGGGS